MACSTRTRTDSARPVARPSLMLGLQLLGLADLAASVTRRSLFRPVRTGPADTGRGAAHPAELAGVMAGRVPGRRGRGGGGVQLRLLIGGQFRGQQIGQDHGAGQVRYFLIADAPARRGPPGDRLHGDGGAVVGRAAPVITRRARRV
jgi:hypothetical protein